ncbi:Type II/IV secretion system protein TadC, associated with Flp pilus assembly [hydrothermal vent metagenome]|uniref:Type II/IV secretion system protein TadC, associated with Flp pilus assembly n=1 Tax=hydrothermal vent metagenome TaxID=652676 RepID=A0A3B1D5J5_9ZZZZ
MNIELIDIVPIAVFGVVMFIAWALYNAFSSKTSRAAERLEEIRDPGKRKERLRKEGASNGMGEMLEKAAPQLSRALKPKTELEQSALKIRLANAGFNAPNSWNIYLTLKLIFFGLGIFVGMSVGAIRSGLMTQEGITALVIGGGVGFYIPEAVLWYLRITRQESIFLSLPDALDLLVVCVEAGLGLDAGMRRVSEELNDSNPELCQELDLCNFQLQMGRKRRDVLHDLGVRTGVDDMRALAAILIQADKFGSSIAQALRAQSESMRVKRSQLAEEKAAQTAVKMIFPLVLFIFPGIFVVLVGPAAIMLIEGLLNDGF